MKYQKMSDIISIINLLKLKSRFLIIPFLLMFFLETSFAQQNKFQTSNTKFEHITNSDGLMHNSIRFSFQDSRGYMWFGTNNGLYKYNGYEFKIYNNELGNKYSLIGNRITSISEDSSGKVWIGTNKGLCTYNRDSDSFVRDLYNSEISSYFTFHNFINTIFIDALDNIWLGTPEGLYNLKKSSKGFKLSVFKRGNQVDGLASNYISCITQYKEGLLIGTPKGLNKLEFSDDDQVKITRIKNNVIGSVNITSLFVDSDLSIWVGTLNGLHKIETSIENTFNFYTNYLAEIENSFANNSIKTIHQVDSSTIWIGTLNSGIFELNKDENVVKIYQQNPRNIYSLESNDINNIFKDDFGVVWVSTNRGGVSKLNLKKNKIDHFKNNVFNSNSLSGNLINTIFEDSNQNVWIGTFRTGLNLLMNNSKEKEFIHFNKADVGSNNIHAICEDNYGNMWLGSMSDGITQVQVQKGKISKIARFTKENTNNALMVNKVTIMYKDKRGDIWMGGDPNSGLIRLTPNKEFGKLPQITQFKRLKENTNSLTSNYVFSIYEDSQNVLWVGLNGSGLVKIIRDENNNPIHYTRIMGREEYPSGLNNNQIFAIHEDNYQNIWIATFGGGLNKILKEEINKKLPKIIKYKQENGLPSNEIYGILEDENQNLWISSNSGISKYDIEKKIFTNLGLKDGLQALNFRKGAYFKGKNGMMYFGGINGFNSFNPNSFVKNEVPPKVELTGFKLFNNEVGVGEKILGKAVLNKNISETNEIVLKHGHNSFSFEFSAMHYASPNQNNYMYMLDGFDKDWIPTSSKRRFVTYANLDSKDYVFKVIASNSDNVWNSNARELKLKVLPALWKTWWAYTLFILFAIFLMWLFRRNILVRAEYRNSLKIEKLEQNKIKVLNKMKLEFFTNISHEFKTPLTLILGPLQNLLKMEIVDSKLKESLLIMDRNANYLFRLINQVMDFRKVETNQLKVITSKGNLVDFCEEVVLSFNVLANEKNLNLSFESSEPELIVYFDWDKMDKILNNLISNSIKYTPDSGNVKVSLSFINNGISKKSNVLDLNSEIEIIVEDTGVGIPENKISKIFRRFYQVEESNKSNSFGSGVGLALTKKLIDLLQGQIEVKSNLNEGSQFIVKFPVITAKTDVMRDAEIDSEEVFVSGSGLVINENIHKEIGDSIKTLPSLLIVEDNPDMQTFLKSSLEGSYKILQAYDGVQGLKIALENIPNIIISDVMMPNMDGIQFCNEIKQNEITNHIPIILLSARASIDHKIEGLKVGADVYIPKPFDMRLLKIKTQKLLEEREFLIEKFASKGITLDSQKIGINHTEKAFLEKAEKVIEDNLTNSEFGVEDLGRALSFSRMQLYRKFKSVRGLSANEFIRAYRIKKAALLLRETDLNVSEILYTIGFTNRSYFAKCFKKSFDMSPKEYSTKHREKLKRERDSEIE